MAAAMMPLTSSSSELMHSTCRPQKFVADAAAMGALHAAASTDGPHDRSGRPRSGPGERRAGRVVWGG